MAYVSQELKSKLVPNIKAICKKYGVQASVSVDHHSTLCLNIKSAKIDFIGSMHEVVQRNPHRITNGFVSKSIDHISVNTFHYKNHFDGKALEFLDEIVPALQGPDFFDETNISTDYFHCSHYIEINVGKWDKPFVYISD